MRKKGPRGTLYNPDFCIIAAKVLARGGSKQDIARQLFVGDTTMATWEKKHPEFAEAIAIGLAIADRLGYKRKNGPKTKYRPEYCLQVIEALAQGKSLAGFAASIGVEETLVRDWRDRHPEFGEAVAIGETASQSYWEDIGKHACTGGAKDVNPAVYGWIMANRFKWISSRSDNNNRHAGHDGGALKITWMDDEDKQ